MPKASRKGKQSRQTKLQVRSGKAISINRKRRAADDTPEDAQAHPPSKVPAMESESHVEIHVQSHTETHVQSHTETHVQSHVETHVESHVETHVQSHVETHVQSEVETHVQSEVETHVQSDVEAQGQTRVKTRDATNTTPTDTNSQHEITSPPSAPYPSQPLVSPLNLEATTWSQYRIASCFLTPSTAETSTRRCPLPHLNWADADELWEIMWMEDAQGLVRRDSQLFVRHPTLQPRMRAILLDWLIEVCEVYKLHRETYYRALDFIDRYLSCRQSLPKNQLQLVGVTCLFIASKFEEIYPPKVAEFAYVTDGACTDKEILGKELVILKGLDWRLGGMIPPIWLSVFMQTESGDLTSPETFVYPQYEGLQYSQASQLIDLATLDEGSLKFSYGMLAVAAIAHTMGRDIALRVSRMTWEQIAPCAKWLSTFALTVSDESAQALLRSNIPSCDTNNSASGLRTSVPRINLDQTHRIQTHAIDLEMLEVSQQRQSMMLADCLELEGILDSEASPASSPAEIQEQSGLLTPPSSIQKNSLTPPRLPSSIEPYT